MSIKLIQGSTVEGQLRKLREAFETRIKSKLGLEQGNQESSGLMLDTDVLGFDPQLHENGDLSAVFGERNSIFGHKFTKKEKDEKAQLVLSDLMKKRVKAVVFNDGAGDCYYKGLAQQRLLMRGYAHLHVRYTDMLFVLQHAGTARMSGPHYLDPKLYDEEERISRSR